MGVSRGRRVWAGGFGLLLGVLTPFAHGEGISEVIGPDRERLPVTGVPFLNEKILEALTPGDGLWIEPETPFQWSRVTAGEAEIALKLRIDETRFDGGVLTMWNWHNHPVGQWELSPGPEQPVRFRFRGQGAYLLTLDGYRDEVCRARAVRSLAVTGDHSAAREVWQQDDFFLGICSFPGRYHWSFQGVPTLPAGLGEQEARELEAGLMNRLGFQLVRTDESMEMGDRTSPDADYRFQFGRMDAAVEAYTSLGFSLALQLMNAPDWAVKPGYEGETRAQWRFPRREEPQRAYVHSLVERYGDQARFVQIFNEPDQVEFWAGSPGEFVEHFAFSREEVNRVRPGLPVVSGGYSLADPERTDYFVRALKGKVTFPAYHSHGTLEELMEDHRIIRRMHEEAGYESPRFVNTEMGFDGWRLDQERRKGEIVPQKVLYCWASGHAGVLVFGSRMTLGPKRVTQDFGFLDHWFCPRFVYGSMGALVSTLAGARFERVLGEEDGVSVYSFRRGKERIVAAFTTKESASVRLLTEDPAVVLVDPMGNRTALLNEGSVDLPLDGYPRYLISGGAPFVLPENWLRSAP